MEGSLYIVKILKYVLLMIQPHLLTIKTCKIIDQNLFVNTNKDIKYESKFWKIVKGTEKNNLEHL